MTKYRKYTKIFKIGGKANLRPFFKKAKLNIFPNQQSEDFIQLVFIEYQVVHYRNILKISCRPLAFTLYKAFLKNKKMSGTSCLSFCMIFEEKCFSCYILLTDQISFSGCLYFVRYWGIYILQLFV